MLNKKHKIAKREFIPFILAKGKTENTSLFVIKYLYNKEEISHFGVIASTKISKKAVIRNKIRRRIYEAIRLFLKENPDTKKSIDAIFLTKKSITEADFKTISILITNILHKIL
jgi:ribonuclease P protein component